MYEDSFNMGYRTGRLAGNSCWISPAPPLSSCQALQFTYFLCQSAFPFFSVFPKSGFTSGFAFPLNRSTTLERQSSLSPVIGFCVLAYDQIRLLPTAQYKQGNSTDLPVFIYLLYILLFQFIIIQNYLHALYISQPRVPVSVLAFKVLLYHLF